MDQMSDQFDDDDADEENRLDQFESFQRFQATIEKFLLQRILVDVPDFDLNAFLATADDIQDDDILQNPDVQDILTSLADFQAFKELVLSRKRGASLNRLEDMLSVVSLKK